MKKRMTERKKGWLILSLSLDAFAGLGLEVLLAFWLEPMIYGRTMEQWNTWQSVLHWCITCIIWGSVAGYLLWSADKNYGLKLIKRDGGRHRQPPVGKALAMGACDRRVGL